MKRSRHIALLGMGVSTLVLTACSGGDKIDGTTFASVADCIAGKTLTESQCMRAFEIAVDEHDSTAPRFTTQAQCESVAGDSKCERAPSSSSSSSTSSTYRPSFLAFFVPHLGPSIGKVHPLYPQKSAVGLAPAATLANTAKVAGFTTHSPRAPAITSIKSSRSGAACTNERTNEGRSLRGSTVPSANTNGLPSKG